MSYTDNPPIIAWCRNGAGHEVYWNTVHQQWFDNEHNQVCSETTGWMSAQGRVRNHKVHKQATES